MRHRTVPKRSWRSRNRASAPSFRVQTMDVSYLVIVDDSFTPDESGNFPFDLFECGHVIRNLAAAGHDVRAIYRSIAAANLML